MKIIINGKEEIIDRQNFSILELLIIKDVKMPEMVSVELNGEIINKDKYDEIIIKEGDKIEFLYFMGGGEYIGFATKAIHSGYEKDKETGATFVPIYSSASYEYEKAEDLADVFDGRKYGYIYSRIANPTVNIFEQKINTLENGIGAVATSSGMSAIAAIIFALTESGDEIISSKNLFGGTLLFFNEIMKTYNVKVNFVDACDIQAYKKFINKKTKLIFIETIANPKLNIPDVKKIAEIANQNEIPLIIDSTITTPYLFKAKKHGVSIVVHSATKYLTGNGTAIGGVLIDTGNFLWQKSKSPKVIKYTNKFGNFGFLACIRKNIIQNSGACLSPFNAFLHCIGLETLALRMEKHCENAKKLAEYLKQHTKIINVNYPGLSDNEYYEISAKQFNNKFGGILTIRLGNKEKSFRLINNLKLAKNLANIGDVRTLVIHPASTIFHECSKEEMEEAGVYDDLIRISVGLEDFEDIINDFEQALKEV
ncbi:MAG: sulfur carrier protein ThiS [Candidatus Omnitrophica bacterium]|nr:sulfur carrier protein ThiS [Candidatus Omnitrophota bacterium]